jgi:hypothetical protein
MEDALRPRWEDGFGMNSEIGASPAENTAEGHTPVALVNWGSLLAMGGPRRATVDGKVDPNRPACNFVPQTCSAPLSPVVHSSLRC